MALRAGLSLNPLTRPISTSLYLLDVDDGGSRHIASGHYVAAAWSPDGSQIAAVDYYRGRHLVVMDADGTEQQTLANMIGYGYDGLFTGISWHPAP
jgi:Tol biopolymer transport system component